MSGRVYAFLLLCLSSFAASAETIHQATSFAILGSPKYPANFTHFDYVNPDAPKEGTVVLSALGSFDNFNRFALRGTPAARSDSLWDGLFTTSDDEIYTLYPLIALSARYPEDMRWMEVEMNPKARFHDNSPITADDVVFSIEKYIKEGTPQFRSLYKDAKFSVLNRYKVRFELATPNRDNMFSLLQWPVMPRSFWSSRSIAEPLITPPLGSGPYRISDYKLGQYVVYSRVKDYWAADLPVNRGRNNFDTLRYEYYLDDNVALEAFRAGDYDARAESSPKNWDSQYKGKNFDHGYIVKQDILSKAAQGNDWLSFNTTRPFFSDRRVRLAVTLSMDFNWLNKAFYYNSFNRSRSYFQNTIYEANQLPDREELYWLTPLKGEIPDEVLTQIYQPPVTRGNGDNRDNLLKAAILLKDAGWEIKQQKLVNSKTGQPFRFELTLLSGRDYPYALPFKHNLARLGIQMDIRSVDSQQLLKRLRDRDFDMMPRTYSANPYPSPSLDIIWGSAYIDSTWNTPGVQNKAVDLLLKNIIQHQCEPQTLLKLGHALDRVLTWNYYNLPLGYSPHSWLAYWNKFSMPAIRPVYSLGFDTWWFDSRKAAQLPDQRR